MAVMKMALVPAGYMEGIEIVEGAAAEATDGPVGETAAAAAAPLGSTLFVLYMMSCNGWVDAAAVACPPVPFCLCLY